MAIYVEYYTEEEPGVLKTMTISTQDLYEYVADLVEQETGQNASPEKFYYEINN